MLLKPQVYKWLRGWLYHGIEDDMNKRNLQSWLTDTTHQLLQTPSHWARPQALVPHHAWYSSIDHTVVEILHILYADSALNDKYAL